MSSILDCGQTIQLKFYVITKYAKVIVYEKEND